MAKPSVERALPFNCPKCEAAIGELCTNAKGQPMSRFVHPEREPHDVLQSEFNRWKMRRWLWANGHILLGDE